MQSLYFLNSTLKNAPLQVAGYQRRLKIRPFPAFGGPKCHRSEKRPLERGKMRKVLTSCIGRMGGYGAIENLLVSGENPEHLYLCAYYSVFLTKSSLRGLAQSLEETTEHRRGRKPPVVVRQRKKPRQGDRILNMLSANLLDFLSPL